MAAAKTAGISKVAAVKKALRELGKDAMPAKIQEYLKATFSLEMPTGHISSYKSYILKMKKRKKAAGVVPASANGSVSLGDLAAVKELVGRVGEDKLKSLIGLLG